jgi:hypothetical protein
MREPNEECAPQSGGEQRLYKFANGYGASVVRSAYSYGGKNGKWELAVICYAAGGDYSLCYTTPITNDVIGWLDDADVDALLDKIEDLPTHKEEQNERH